MILKPPAPLPTDPGPIPTVFLAGSIEMGAAPDWQAQYGQVLSAKGCFVLNPRRDGWDPSWVQRAAFPQFRAQVEWEMDGLERSDAILMYFAPGTKSPISLLELGLHAPGGKLFVCCPDDFWRKGNVELVCERAEVPLFLTLDDTVAALCAFLRNKRWVVR